MTARERVREWVLAKAASGDVVGKLLAVGAELRCSEDSVKRVLKDMRDTGEILEEKIGHARRRFFLPDGKERGL